MRYLIAWTSWRSAILLLLASGLPVLVNFLLSPLITANVSIFEYGQFVSYLTVCSVINVLIGLSVGGYISNAHLRPQEAPQIISSMGCFMLATVLPVGTLACIGAYLSNLPNMAIVAAIVLGGVFNFISTTFQSYVILGRKYGQLLLLSSIQALVQASAVGALLGLGQLTLWGLILSNLGAFAAAACCAMILLLRRGVSFRRPSAAAMLRLLAYGIPLVPHLFLSLATGSFDRWLLIGEERVDDLAIYAVALSVSSAVYLLLDVWNKLYSPSIFEMLAAANYSPRVFARKIFTFIAFGVAVSAVSSAVGFVFITYAFHVKYESAAWLSVHLCIASGAFTLYCAASPFLYYFNRTGLILLSTSAGALVAVVLSMAFFDLFGLHGLIYGKMLGFITTGVVALTFTAKLIRERYSIDGRII